MINFRYHIVSLMAVFLALAVGIAAGVSIGPSVNEGVVQQAAQDRNQVSELRAEIDRRNGIDQYRQTYEQQTGKVVTAGELSGYRVAVVRMPDAPPAVVQAVSTAVTDAGGSVVRNVRVSDDVFDATKSAEVSKALEPHTALLSLNNDMSAATEFGTALAFSIADKQITDRDDQALSVGKSLTNAGLANISSTSTAKAQLVIVITAPTATPATTPEVLSSHVDMDLALRTAVGVVLAGPNSHGLESTDVLTARTESAATDRLSTVDVADLSSGVTTTVLAGRELLLDKPSSHYGALAGADAVAPTLPVR